MQQTQLENAIALELKENIFVIVCGIQTTSHLLFLKFLLVIKSLKDI